MDAFQLLLIVGLVPSYPACRLLSYVGPPRFPFYFFGLPPRPHSLFRVSLLLLLLPALPPFPLGITHCGCAALPTQLGLILVPLYHEPFGCFEDTRYHFPASFAAVDHSPVSTPSTKGDCSVDPSVARNSPEVFDYCMHLCQVLCPPGLGFSPPAIVSNTTRLSNRSLLCRATAPAKKSRRLRMVVSMLRQRVILRAFAHERVVWSVRSRRWKPMTPKRTWW